MFKILKARLQQYTDHEIPNAQAGFNKGRGNINQISNMCGIINITRAPEKIFFFTFSSLFISKVLTVWIKTNCGKFLK